jgi:hypothetical protein
MKKFLVLWILIITYNCYAFPARIFLPQMLNTPPLLEALLPEFYQSQASKPSKSLAQIKAMLMNNPNPPHPRVIEKVLRAIECNRLHSDNDQTLSIIDYSRPSNQKRFWIYDLTHEKLLFNTYVAHGINSGALLTEYFSNRNNSKASSFGVFNTNKTYYGRHGLSLRLDGLERKFNDNAANRAIVMHGSWYVNENFIKRYGRAGRSWGCPAVPAELTKPIINALKEKSLMVVYYPNDNWFNFSKFLNCRTPSSAAMKFAEATPPDTTRENILFADINKNSRREENETIVVMDATHYEKTFNTRAPLDRMLRRRINKVEYIALSDREFAQLQESVGINGNEGKYNDLLFVVPEIKMHRGYYATEMKIVNYGKIKDVNFTSTPPSTLLEFHVTLEMEKKITLRPTNSFTRWLGL